MLHGRNKRFLFPWEKKFFHMQNIFIVPAMQHGCRAKPLYSPTSIKRPPFLKRPLSKVPIYLPVNCCIWHLYSTATSIKRPRAATFLVSQVYFLYGFLPPLSGQQIFFTSIWWIIFNKSSVKYRAKFFKILSIDAKRSKKPVHDVLYFFCTLSTRRNTVHFNYAHSVLELELCMGWKCTWCFGCNEVWTYILISVRFLKHFAI